MANCSVSEELEMKTKPTEKLEDTIIRLLQHAGIGDYEVVQPNRNEFGVRQTVFRVGNLLLKFDEERDQVLTSVTSRSNSKTFYPFFTIGVAMGWRDIAEVKEIGKFEEVDETISCIARNFEKLNIAFNPSNEVRTLFEIQKIDDRINRMFENHLRRVDKD